MLSSFPFDMFLACFFFLHQRLSSPFVFLHIFHHFRHVLTQTYSPLEGSEVNEEKRKDKIRKKKKERKKPSEEKGKNLTNGGEKKKEEKCGKHLYIFFLFIY
ncbi:hypothetical protein, unlikely [Trypanosoma brucei gambiense DAL972]|uniref:Uncharacterized protein n=1 Tax=Trypanosoma brucei gambiense (strain MHOM/CI/86/DAL972) TaxID=679716 RepID=C9ZVQ3_TRYB9|nr:hypothetical protein, unlikely [Trypanosoma brucei gambiense DAL972]CBH13491.1 hypothetical protein, unlikely [Trypanosoma brucei gambiense DAL972]|eukprot:XP_011775768.1 hypothetical protein, unlikely [Trypanosoma brucei gambiense DAL972]